MLVREFVDSSFHLDVLPLWLCGSIIASPYFLLCSQQKRVTVMTAAGLCHLNVNQSHFGAHAKTTDPWWMFFFFFFWRTECTSNSLIDDGGFNPCSSTHYRSISVCIKIQQDFGAYHKMAKLTSRLVLSLRSCHTLTFYAIWVYFYPCCQHGAARLSVRLNLVLSSLHQCRQSTWYAVTLPFKHLNVNSRIKYCMFPVSNSFLTLTRVFFFHCLLFS